MCRTRKVAFNLDCLSQVIEVFPSETFQFLGGIFLAVELIPNSDTLGAAAIGGTYKLKKELSMLYNEMNEHALFLVDNLMPRFSYLGYFL